MYLIGSTYTHGADHKSGTKLHKVVENLEKGKDWIIDHLKYDKKLCSWVKRDNRMRLYYIESATCWIIAQIPLSYVVRGHAGTLDECKSWVEHELRGMKVEFKEDHGFVYTYTDGTIDYVIAPLKLAGA